METQGGVAIFKLSGFLNRTAAPPRKTLSPEDKQQGIENALVCPLVFSFPHFFENKEMGPRRRRAPRKEESGDRNYPHPA